MIPDRMTRDLSENKQTDKSPFAGTKGEDSTMATWMAHLRIADRLLDIFDGIERTEFIMGNIAPDSGVPCGDRYVPDKNTSHFKNRDSDGETIFGWRIFADKYLSPEKIKTYNKKEFSFYLGYLTHLLADEEWKIIMNPLKEKDGENYKKDKHATVSKWKKDWYDLDHLFIRDNPDFRAFEIYKNAGEFKNTFLDFFSETAFDERRAFIVDFYSHIHDDLDREYVWLTEETMREYIEKAVGFIKEKTTEYRLFEVCED